MSIGVKKVSKSEVDGELPAVNRGELLSLGGQSLVRTVLSADIVVVLEASRVEPKALNEAGRNLTELNESKSQRDDSAKHAEAVCRLQTR